MSKPEFVTPGYTHLAIEPYTPNIGAVIHDFDLSTYHHDGVRVYAAE